MIFTGDSGDEQKPLVGITPQDEANLRRAAAVIGRSVDAIVDRFFEEALAHPVHLDGEALERIRSAQKSYFRRLLSGERGPTLAAERDHVARIHETLGIPSRHYLGSYLHFLRSASEGISGAPGLSPQEASACVTSLAKALFLDLVQAIDAYTEARLARLEIYRSAKVTDLSELISDIAHELDAPIAAAVNFSEILPVCSKEEAEGTLLALNECLKQCHAVVRELLVYARKEPRTRVAVDLNHLIGDTMSILEPRLKSQGISLQKTLSPELPPVTGDPGQLRQIFTIILGSAQQAIRGSRKTGSIAVSTRAGDGKVQCVMVDDGEGSQARSLQQIFDPFLRTDWPSGEMAFSLHTCRAMLRDHGGDLRIDSVPGAGTTVMMELPVRVAGVAEKVAAVATALRGSRVLVVDDKAAVRLFVCDVLDQAGAEAMGASGMSAAVAALGKEAFDLLVVGGNMGDGEKVVAEALQRTFGPRPGIVVCMDEGGEEHALRSLAASCRLEALRKPFTAVELAAAAARALSARGIPPKESKVPAVPVPLPAEPVAAPSGGKAAPHPERPLFQDMVGRSAVMQEVFRRLRLASQSDVAVLVTGESGTGKELAARAIHSLSERRDKPFLGVNCSAFPETLLESELFGHVKGAFTGAVRDKVGVFQAAEGGTLFLDEIGDTSPLLQLKLLRVLEEMEIRRVGDDRAVKINVRLVTATHRDLTSLICSGRIREDFYYRIRVFGVHLPPLRERKEDIPALVEHFIRRMAESSRKAVTSVSEEALDRLIEYPWPGNARELRNAVEHAFVTVRGESITLGDLPPEIGDWRGAGPAVARPPRLQGDGSDGAEEQERQRIREALAQSGGNKTQAARQLGISRVTLWNRIHRLGIE